MRNAEIYTYPPLEFRLRNNGVAKVSDGQTEDEIRTLRYELETFVCEGQYEAGLARILRSYVSNLGETEQPAAWVSGFFGSGKSHLVKMLRYLWVDFVFGDGATARDLASRGALPSDVTDALTDLSTMGRRHGGLHAASGTLSANAGDSVRLALLAIIFQSVGLPASYPRARFVMRLKREGIFDAFERNVAAAGKTLFGDGGEIGDLRASPVIARAVLEAGGAWGADEREIRAAIRAEYADVTDVSNEDMLRAMREALSLATDEATPDSLPCTLVALDEVQQYIGDSVQRSMDVQEAVEACSKGLGSRVFIVGTGQNALQAVPLLHRLMGRFTVKVQLSDADVETVTRKTVLSKTNAAIPAIEQALDVARGEIDRHLKGTTIQPKKEDRAIEVADYPVLPARRRFWEQVIQSRGNAGTESQLRNQLKVVDDAVKATADKPLGTVVGGDFVYERETLLQSGELTAEIDARIERLRREGDPLDVRICILAWLIGKLSRESGSDTGLRATAETMGDLLVEDLAAGSSTLRRKIDERLVALQEAGDLMPVDGEVRIQTTQSAEWDRAFKSRQTAVLNDAPALATERDDRLRARATRLLDPVRKVLQGTSKEPRTIEIAFGGSAPSGSGQSVPVWIRSGWDVSAEAVRADARGAGIDSPLVTVYLPERGVEPLRKALATARAAQDTLHTRGVPTEQEGRDARKSIEARLEGATRDIEALLADVFAGAQVILGGGSDVGGTSLADAVQTGALDALQRLFPDFDTADDGRWGRVFEEAKKGATAALDKVDYQGKPEENPVCAAVLRFVGAGKKGAEVRAHFQSAPYGWPADAVSGALAVLAMHGQVQASRDGQPVAVKEFDTRGINQIHFRAEDVVLSFNERLAIAHLIQNADASIAVKPNDVHQHVGDFMRAAREIAKRAGGDAPLPAIPAPPVLDEIAGMVGNAQLRHLYGARNDLNTFMSEWGTLSSRRTARLEAWHRLGHAVRHADGLPEAQSVQAEMTAVREQRSLLAESDPLAGLDDRLTGALRAAVTDARVAYAVIHERETAALESDTTWGSLGDTDRAFILGRHALTDVPAIDVSTLAALLSTLDERSLATWRDQTAALPARFKQAYADAARKAEPDAPAVRQLRLSTATLRTAADVEAWLNSTRARLLAEIQQGPIVL